ncbi:hypothetical protein SALBM217S_10844 [Streptomyces griseoloalbus]
MVAGPPVLPPDLAAEAVRRGARMLRRRTYARRVLWLLLVRGGGGVARCGR